MPANTVSFNYLTYFPIYYSVTVKEFFEARKVPRENPEKFDYVVKVRKHKTQRGGEVCVVLNEKLYKFIKSYLLYLHPTKGNDPKAELFPTMQAENLSELTGAVRIFNKFVQSQGKYLLANFYCKSIHY